MIINKPFYMLTHVNSHALDVGIKYDWNQGIFSEVKSTPSQKWNLVPYFKDNTVFFLLVNENNTILAHDNPNYNTVAYSYDPDKITYMHCWSISQDNENNTIFRALDCNYKATNYVLTANGNHIGDNARISAYRLEDTDQKWELLDKILIK